VFARFESAHPEPSIDAVEIRLFAHTSVVAPCPEDS
jgi:hypothetical protein